MDMQHLIMKHANEMRLGFFLGVLLFMALWEMLGPRRKLDQPKGKRWFSNLGIVVLNTLVLRILFPAGIAVIAAHQQWGLFNQFHVNFTVSFFASIVILDLAIYLQHVMFHAIPIFWRFHRMHHVDLNIDVTTGIRFHPIEIVLSIFIKLGVILLFGIPVSAIIIFEVLLNATSLFNHGNVRLWLPLDRIIRWIIVTPDMHRVHHSILPDETNSNFGFNFSIWDRLFGTYRDQPSKGHTGMTIGITTFRTSKICTNLIGMLYLPFIGKITEYAINRREKKKIKNR